MSNTISIRLSDDLSEWLQAEAERTGLSKGSLVREQLERYRTARARQPFLDLAGSLEGEPDASSKRGFEP